MEYISEQNRRKAVARTVKYLRKQNEDYSEIIKSLLRRDLDSAGEYLLYKDSVQGLAQNKKEKE